MLKTNTLALSTALASLLTLAIACSDLSGGKGGAGGGDTRKPTNNTPFDDGFDPNAGPFSEAKMLANIGLNVIAPATQKLRLQIEALNATLNAADVDLAKARTQWAQAMLTYHFLAASAIGPLSDTNLMIREQLYGWPNFNPCGVDLQVAKLTDNAKPDLSKAGLPYTIRGLGALEYVLHEAALTTQCNPRNPSHKPAFDWAQKTPEQKQKTRLGYAAYLSADALATASQLEQAWDPKRGNFSKALYDGSANGSVKESVNALSDALFAIEEVKNRKLGRPLGLGKDCLSAEQKCPDMVEHLYSGLSLQAVEAHMNGFVEAFNGGTGFGFDDYLTSLKYPDVAAGIVSLAKRAIETAQAAQRLGTLQQQIQNMDINACRASTSDDKRVVSCGLWSEIRLVATRMKTDLLTILALRMPPIAQGDND